MTTILSPTGVTDSERIDLESARLVARLGTCLAQPIAVADAIAETAVRIGPDLAALVYMNALSRYAIEVVTTLVGHANQFTPHGAPHVGEQYREQSAAHVITIDAIIGDIAPADDENGARA